MTQASPVLDSFDLKILAALQADASRSISEIAGLVNLSQNACWRRIKLLEEAGFIRARVALLDAKKLGCGVTVFVSLSAGEHTEAWLESFAERVAGMPEVVEFYRMSGEVDYLIKLQVADIAAYDRVYKELIRAGRLRDVSAAFAMEELKHTHEVPLPPPGRPARAG
jgi:Lrp/AsnC family transcriptional regulator